MKQEPILNHTFKIPYKKPTTPFLFTKKNSIVGYESYEDRIVSKISDIGMKLYMDPHSRQAVIIVNEESAHMSCLLSIQFQLYKDTLYVNANYRSMCSKYGRPYDEKLICWVTLLLKNTHVMRTIIKPVNVEISFNVGNYHVNPNGKYAI